MIIVIGNIGSNRNGKTSDKGWILILPDSDRPVFRVTAEGMNEEYARELMIDYKAKIAGYLN